MLAWSYKFINTIDIVIAHITISCLSKLEINTTQYKRGGIVVLDAPKDDLQQFGEIKH